MKFIIFVLILSKFCDSEATTVASMVERSKQDGGAGWLADRDLEDGCSFCNIFL